MKGFAAGVLVGLMASCAVAFASTPFDHNGLFWSRLNNSAKTGYVTGYADAMQVSLGKLDSLTIAADMFHWKGADRIIHQLARELSTSGMSNAQAVQRLNRLYANHKYSELDLGSALQLLTMRAQGGATSPTPPR